MNVVEIWLALIGTKARAEQLLAHIEILDGKVHKDCGGTVAGRRCMRCRVMELSESDWIIKKVKPCPTKFLFPKHLVERLYAAELIRPALDAWDQGLVGKMDIKRWAEWIRDGNYNGPAVTVGGLENEIQNSKTARSAALQAEEM